MPNGRVFSEINALGFFSPLAEFRLVGSLAVVSKKYNHWRNSQYFRWLIIPNVLKNIQIYISPNLSFEIVHNIYTSMIRLTLLKPKNRQEFNHRNGWTGQGSPAANHNVGMLKTSLYIKNKNRVSSRNAFTHVYSRINKTYKMTTSFSTKNIANLTY